MAKYIDRDYLKEQFRIYDTEVAEQKYSTSTFTPVPATSDTLGCVMVDDDTIVIDENGVITAISAVAANELSYAETMAILNASS